MLNLFPELNSPLPDISSKELSDAEVILEIAKLKLELKDQVLILGHHYQQDDVIQFADIVGDSLALSRAASKVSSPYIVFCGVHFMAETADMLTSPSQKIILPDLKAGCSMADMASLPEVEKCWAKLSSITADKIVPITYINSSASLKAFVGKMGGAICTSSNAKQVISWAFDEGKKLLFFPDQHLGRNSCYELGISLEEMITYTPSVELNSSEVQKAKVILWHGYCSVHQGFNTSHIEKVKKESPESVVIVHPECDFPTVQASDLNGSTSFIIETIKAANPGSSFAVGTEINLVSRLAKQFPDKKIFSLSPYQCLCTTMYRIRPRWLLSSLRSIKKKKPNNIISVDQETTKWATVALDRMLRI